MRIFEVPVWRDGRLAVAAIMSTDIVAVDDVDAAQASSWHVDEDLAATDEERTYALLTLRGGREKILVNLSYATVRDAWCRANGSDLTTL